MYIVSSRSLGTWACCYAHHLFSSPNISKPPCMHRRKRAALREPLVGRKPPELPKDQDTPAALLLSLGVWAAETGGSSPQAPGLCTASRALPLCPRAYTAARHSPSSTEVHLFPTDSLEPGQPPSPRMCLHLQRPVVNNGQPPCPDPSPGTASWVVGPGDTSSCLTPTCCPPNHRPLV